MDQSVQVHHRAQGVLDGPFTEQREFRALVEQDETSLRVVILSPFGAAALMVSLSASGDIETDVRMPMELPFPPAYILRDIQRAFYPSLDEVCHDDVDAEGRIHERQGCNDAFSVRYRPARNLNAAEQSSGHVVFTTESYALDIEIHSPEAPEGAPSR